jgi:hypothetical protein
MCNNMCMVAVTVDVAMSGTRLFEALKAEARRSGDRLLVARWNLRAEQLGRKLDGEKARRTQGMNAYAALGW